MTPPAPLIQPVQAGERTDCLIGENQWRTRMGN
jgi:hypothetical protein